MEVHLAAEAVEREAYFVASLQEEEGLAIGELALRLAGAVA